MEWTDERVALLKKLWSQEELTAREIAERIGGITRSAVIGKAHRLSLPPKALPKKKAPHPEDIMLPRKACRWPKGDPRSPEFSFCARDVVPGRSYCLEHCVLAYRNISGRL